MNKEEIKTGDLVATPMPHGCSIVGLVIDERPGPRWALRYRVYWFKTGRITHYSATYLIKLEIPNE
jgi:hypothetical protein